MHWMYTAIVRPNASFIWFKEAEKLSFRLKLNKLQRLACILISGAMRSTPTVALEALLGLSPLHLFMKSEAKVFNYKLNIHPDSTIQKLTYTSLNKEQENDNILRIKESDIMLPKYNFEFPYQVTIPSREEWASKSYDEQEGTKFFTDGSKTEHGTGYGIYGEFEVEQNLTNTAKQSVIVLNL